MGVDGTVGEGDGRDTGAVLGGGAASRMNEASCC